jgi:hypothetical protein
MLCMLSLQTHMKMSNHVWYMRSRSFKPLE